MELEKLLGDFVEHCDNVDKLFTQSGKLNGCTI